MRMWKKLPLLRRKNKEKKGRKNENKKSGLYQVSCL